MGIFPAGETFLKAHQIRKPRTPDSDTLVSALAFATQIESTNATWGTVAC